MKRMKMVEEQDERNPSNFVPVPDASKHLQHLPSADVTEDGKSKAVLSDASLLDSPLQEAMDFSRTFL